MTLPPGTASRPSVAGRLQSFSRQLCARRDSRAALFSSFGGRFSDNPRAIWEQLLAQGSPLSTLWVSEGGAVPADIPAVPLGGPAYAQALGRSRLLVSNERLPQLVKKPGVIYLQTWHGTMLKRIGYDNPRFADDAAGLRRAAKDYARWDLLVSQSPFCTRTMRGAFRYDGEVLEVGYPRNDLLLAPEAAQVRRAVRAAYGVADDMLLVLYAPTFRDGDTGRQRLPLDLDLMAAALGESVHVLTRLHHRDRVAFDEPATPIWSPASEHPDIRELYLASDVLVTDYSSVMFDYAVTGKPIVLYTYDLEHYREQRRGFYFDLVEQAPGPVCTTTEAVVAALADLPGLRRESAAAYGEFRATYVPWDDGHAAERVVDRLARDLW